jgi:hypothetical protein
MRRTNYLFLTGLVLFFALFAFLRAEDEPKYTNDSVGRVSFLEGKVFIQRAADVGYEEAVINDPVTEGDRLGTAEGRAEIQFGRRNFLRLDNDTKIDVLNLPKKDSELTRFRVWSGHVYLTVNNLDKEKNIEIHTPDSSFYILEKGIYRFDVDESRGTEILVLKGLAEAAGEQDSYLVKGEQRLEIAEGRFASKPTGFRAVAEDGFDRWNESRDKSVNKFYARRYLPEDMEEVEAELSEYGDWVDVPPYGYVWVPRNVADDWRPYYYGRWVWVPLTGWTWVPYEPWGWAAFHYGRWHWGVGIGWYWIPTSLWGPAWVSWWWDLDYFAWAPLSWYGYPVVVMNGVFYDRYVGHYPLNSRALVVVRKDQLKAPDISRAALRAESLKKASLENKISLQNTTLPFRPSSSRISVEKLDGKRVLVRKDNQSSNIREIKPGSKSGATPETVKPARTTEGKSRQTPKASPGKVTPKKIKKSEDAPSGDSPGYRSSNSLRNIPTYPSSPNITTRNLKRESPASAQRSSGLFKYFNRRSSGSSSRSSSIRSYSSSPKVSSSRISRSSYSSSGSRSSSAPRSSRSTSSGSLHRKK